MRKQYFYKRPERYLYLYSGIGSIVLGPFFILYQEPLTSFYDNVIFGILIILSGIMEFVKYIKPPSKKIYVEIHDDNLNYYSRFFNKVTSVPFDQIREIIIMTETILIIMKNRKERKLSVIPIEKDLRNSFMDEISIVAKSIKSN